MDRNAKIEAEKILLEWLTSNRGQLRGMRRAEEERSFLYFLSSRFAGVELGVTWFDNDALANAYLDGYRKAEEWHLIVKNLARLELDQGVTKEELIKNDMESIYLVNMQIQRAWASDIDGLTLLDIDPDAFRNLHERFLAIK